MTDKYGRRGDGEPCQCDASYIHTVGQHRAHDRLQESPDLMDGGITSALIEEEADAEVSGLGYLRSLIALAQQARDAAQAEAAMCQTSLNGQIRRAEQAEDALVEMTAHRDQCRDTAIKWQTVANRAEQPRPLTADAIESVLHDILPLTANRLGEDDIAGIASDLYLALTAPARDPRAEEIQADLATAEEPEMDDEDRRLIADHLAAMGYRKAES